VNRVVGRSAAYLWAAPVSLAALPIVPFVAVSGGSVRVVDGVLEAAGGILAPLLTRANPWFPISAITLGHVVLAADRRRADESRGHERVHVAQCERWGILLPLLYAASSLVALWTGGRPYEDNAFEKEACRRENAARAA
jgi:hypothetical protein